MKEKKQIERQYLEIVRRALDDFPVGDIKDTDERPDFLVNSPECVLGLEITRIYRNAEPGSPPPQSQDAERDRVVERTQTLAENRGLCPLIADVYFDSQWTIGKQDRDSIAKSLVDLVAAHLPATDEHLTLENRHPLTAEFPPQVEAISMWRFKSLKSHLWQVGDAGIVNEDFAPELRRIIMDKNANVPVYRTRCDKCWLVIVADWRGPSAFFEISDRMSGESYETDFNRVYFLDGYSGHVVLLKTHATVNAPLTNNCTGAADPGVKWGHLFP